MQEYFCNLVLLGASDRPRRLYVVVNPNSGKGHACRIWFRVESMFSDAMIKTDVVCKWNKLFCCLGCC